MKSKGGRIAFFIITNLVLSIIAFSFFASFVSAQEEWGRIGGAVVKLTDKDNTYRGTRYPSQAAAEAAGAVPGGPPQTPSTTQTPPSNYIPSLAATKSTVASGQVSNAINPGGGTPGLINYAASGASLTASFNGKPIPTDQMAAFAAKNPAFASALNSHISSQLQTSTIPLSNTAGIEGLVKQYGMGVSSQTMSDGTVRLQLTDSASGSVVKELSGKGSDTLGSAFSATSAATGEYKSMLFGSGMNWKTGNIVDGFVWAGIVFGAVQLLGGAIGMNQNEKDAISIALGAGILAGKMTAAFMGKQAVAKSAWIPWGVGIGTAVILFLLLYKQTSTKIVNFECRPWEAPTGGDDCQKCNDPLHACSEYRCKSLGQSCAIINAGTNEEQCIWQSRFDVKSPGISPWNAVLTAGYKYTEVRIRPPGVGPEPGRMRIVSESGGCIKAFTPITFGIQTIGPDGKSEPAQCRIDYNHTMNFSNMKYYFGEVSTFRYNHTQTLRLPSPGAVNAASPDIKDDGEYTLYVRCQDANGNVNEGDEFTVRFCVDKGPDTTPPRIEGTSIGNGMPISYNTSKVDIEVYVNEPSECKWSRDEDRDYKLMENSMTCSNQLWEINAQQLYVCKTTLSGMKNRQENKFYLRCKDQPGINENDRNENRESYVLTLTGTQPINILSVGPNGTLRDSVSPMPVYLTAETSNGYKNGESTCYYSTTSSESSYIAFLETGSYRHKQRLDLTSGTYKYYIKCVDLGGNADYKQTNFTVSIDNLPPKVTRAFNDNGKLKIVTDENSDCGYSLKDCNFKIEEGISMPYSATKEHFAEWNTRTNLFVKCKDVYGNQPDPNICSITARGYEKRV